MRYRGYTLAWIVFFVITVIVASCTIGILAGYNDRLAQDREWVDAGVVVSVILHPMIGLGASSTTEIVTGEYVFVVDGLVGVCKIGAKVWWSDEWVNVDGAGSYEIHKERQ